MTQFWSALAIAPTSASAGAKEASNSTKLFFLSCLVVVSNHKTSNWSPASTATPITMSGNSAFKKNYQEKQVFRSSLSAGTTCPNDQQLGKLQICTGFLDEITISAAAAAAQFEIDAK